MLQFAWNKATITRRSISAEKILTVPACFVKHLKEWLKLTVEEKKAKVEKIKAKYKEFMKCYPLNPQSLIDEIWADIEGYKGDYQISNYGRVKSFCTGKERILKPEQNGTGYLNIKLVSGKKHKHFYIHILVANAFIPNPDNLPEVNHKFGIKFDCYFENLEWITPGGNNKHAYDIGLRKQKKGGDNPKAKLTNEEAAWCRKVYKPHDRKFGQRALAKRFNISKECMYYIIHGKTYKDA